MSIVWNHFHIDPLNDKIAVCIHCHARISRGGASKSTSNLLKHFNKQHGSRGKASSPKHGTRDILPLTIHVPELSPPGQSEVPPDSLSSCSRTDESGHSSSSLAATPSSSDAEVVMVSNAVKRKPSKLQCTNQPTLKKFMDKTAKFKIGDARSTMITRKIGEMICLDLQPFSIVENVGFLQLMALLEPRYTMVSRKTLSNCVIPKMYSQTREKVEGMLKTIKFVGITTDLWTSNAQDDYLSITVHFLDEEFDFKHLCIEVIPFPEVSHSAVNIRTFLEMTLSDWGLQEKITCVVRDNGRNVVAALEGSSYRHFSCFAHTLQLVLKEGFLNCKSIVNISAACRRIVGHFKHSSKNVKILKKYQKLAQVPNHRLIQDEPTRWNTTLHMFKRILEQKQAITLASGELKLPIDLTPGQWDMIENSISILEIFDAATLQVSSENVTLSEVIPLVHLLEHELKKPAPTGSGLQGLKNDLLAALSKRFRNIEDDFCCSLATILDPRLKKEPFSNQRHLETVEMKLIEEAKKIQQIEGSDTPLTEEQTQTKEPVPGIWLKYSDAFGKAPKVTIANAVEAEVEAYLREMNAPPNSFPGNYWKTCVSYPRLRLLAKKFLAIPPSTVFSERLFSSAGKICDVKRNRLDPERVKMLCFLCKNLKSVKGE